MRRGLVVLLLLAAGVGLAIGANAQEAPTPAADAPEGVLVTIRPGDRLLWDLPPQQYYLLVATDAEQVTLDLARMPGFERPTWTIEPNVVFGQGFDVAEGDVAEMSIVNGTGRLMVARNDLQQNLPLSGVANRTHAQAHLAEDGCVAYRYSLLKHDKVVRIDLAGEGARHQVLSSRFQSLAAGDGEVSYVADPADHTSVVLQACNLPGGAANVTITASTVYDPATQEAVNQRETPSVPLGAVVAAVAAAALRRRAPRR